MSKVKKYPKDVIEWNHERKSRINHFMPDFLRNISKKDMIQHITEHNKRIKSQYEDLLIKGYSKLNRGEMINLLKTKYTSKNSNSTHIDSMAWKWYEKHDKILDAKYSEHYNKMKKNK